MQVDGNAIHGEICVAQFEEALLKNYAEDFFAQRIFCNVIAQSCGQGVLCFDLHESVLIGDRREFEEIERAFDGVDGEES